MIKGTDLAYCNINVNYTNMKTAGIRFAIIKLGQGLLPKDNMFETHRIGCELVQVPWDLYWFCDYRYSGAVNVNQLISKANGNYGRRHVCQDLEFYKGFGPNPTGRKMLVFCLDFFRTLESNTQLIGTLYTNRDVLTQMWLAADDSEKLELSRHELWFATHTANPIKTHLPIKLNQWDLDAIVPWSQGAVDLDDFIGTDEEFISWVNGSPAPLTLSERVERLEKAVFGI
jgi:hypothetical protein